MSNEIEQFLDSAAQAYYAGAPIISDIQFDNLAEVSTYNRLGHSTVGQKTSKHFHKLYSLQKLYPGDKVNCKLEGLKTVSSPKLDGAAVSLLYIDGVLVQVLTRGNGVEGIDKTDKFLATNIVPQKIDTTVPILQVSGELAAGKHVPNSRNYASGALNLGSIEEFRTRAVEFFAYDCYPQLSGSYSEDISKLSGMGFGTVRDKDLIEHYPIDGVVFRVDSHIQCKELGHTSKHPRFAYALKEEQECYETKIIGVEWNTGRTGKVTPVAILEPINIDGKIVSRATLNNPKFIEVLGICLNDTVGIRLAGMIIPEVVYKADA